MSTPSESSRTNEDRGESPGARRFDSLLDAATLAVTSALLVLALLRVDSPVRVVMASGFTLFAPGWAIVTHWGALRKRTRFGASIVLSLSLLTILAIVSVWIHLWHPVGLMEFEALVVIAAVLLGNLRRVGFARLAAGGEHSSPAS
jgi:uncharacterized membrane protein